MHEVRMKARLTLTTQPKSQLPLLMACGCMNAQPYTVFAVLLVILVHVNVRAMTSEGFDILSSRFLFIVRPGGTTTFANPITAISLAQ